MTPDQLPTHDLWAIGDSASASATVTVTGLVAAHPHTAADYDDGASTSAVGARGAPPRPPWGSPLFSHSGTPPAPPHTAAGRRSPPRAPRAAAVPEQLDQLPNTSQLQLYLSPEVFGAAEPAFAFSDFAGSQLQQGQALGGAPRQALPPPPAFPQP